MSKENDEGGHGVEDDLVGLRVGVVVPQLDVERPDPDPSGSGRGISSVSAISTAFSNCGNKASNRVSRLDDVVKIPIFETRCCSFSSTEPRRDRVDMVLLCVAMNASNELSHS